MPSVMHQFLAALLRDEPGLGLALFRQLTGAAVPPRARLRPHGAQFTDLAPPEYAADAVYLIEDEAQIALGDWCSSPRSPGNRSIAAGGVAQRSSYGQ
ncbi:hypothetical protein [Haliangium sp.]|uniref:hypothetical protein n=1 Tax=Haliangium sp. TaxID=2663208 RepID=UPI003D0A45BC